MANTSILSAFERMWQHITTALSNKSDKNHSHNNATESASGFMSPVDKTQLDNGGVSIVTTTGTGSAYIVTVNGITALRSGIKITIVPHVVSTSVSPTLNVNNLGAKTIRMPVTYNTTATSAGALNSWLAANRPVTLEYDGTYWKTISLPRPSAQYLYGTVPIASGGTGATTAEQALKNLGGLSAMALTSDAYNALETKDENTLYMLTDVYDQPPSSGGDFDRQEVDPTVPTWAKQPYKPTYTASEVGAYSTSEIDSKLSTLTMSVEFANGSTGTYSLYGKEV